MTLSPLLPRDQFIGLEEVTWLYNGAEAPLHRGVRSAVDDYLQARTQGPAGRERNAHIEASCRSRLATLLGGRPEDIALLSNASEAICAVALALNLQGGDNIVINELEFPSGVLAWLAQLENGIEVRLVRHNDWEVSPDAIMQQVDARTRLVMTSHVSYLSGARIDYRALHTALQPTNALLLLDATQSLGIVPVDLQYADFVVSSAYKWLLGMHGGGVLAVNPQRTHHLRSRSVGWRSVPNLFSEDRFGSFARYSGARQFELGYPAFAVVYALNFSVDLLLDTGIERIAAHSGALGHQLLTGLTARSIGLLTPTPR
jgi:selenocysteine lyase/cysteine desulfurase